MIAVDTNVVVRLLVADDAVQTERARALFANNDILVSTTVVLETAWVLMDVFEFDNKAFVRGIVALLGYPRVSLSEPELVSQALDLIDNGVDAADAIHLAAAQSARAFATFDRKLQARAKRLPQVRPEVIAP